MHARAAIQEAMHHGCMKCHHVLPFDTPMQCKFLPASLYSPARRIVNVCYRHAMSCAVSRKHTCEHSRVSTDWIKTNAPCRYIVPKEVYHATYTSTMWNPPNIATQRKLQTACDMHSTVPIHFCGRQHFPSNSRKLS